MGLVARKSDFYFVACEQQRRRSVCASAQSDQCPFSSIPAKYIQTCFKHNFKNLSRLGNEADWFEHDLVGNPEDRFPAMRHIY